MNVFKTLRKSIATIGLIAITFSILPVTELVKIQTTRAAFTGISAITPVGPIMYGGSNRYGVDVTFSTNANDDLPTPNGSCSDSRICYDADGTFSLVKDGVTYQPAIVTRVFAFTGVTADKKILRLLFTNLSFTPGSNDRVNIDFSNDGQLVGLVTYEGSNFNASCSTSPCLPGGGGTGSGAVTGVTGSDPDTTSYGLSGKDFKVTWTPGGTIPTGYTLTKIYFVQSDLTLTASTVNSACTGNTGTSSNNRGLPAGQCIDLGYYMSYQQNNHTVPESESKDSNNAAWDKTKQYKACVLTDASQASLDCSSAFTPSADESITDTTNPVIDHTSTRFAITGTQAVIHTYVYDDVTTQSEFNAQTSDSYVKMYYKANGTVVNVACASVSQVKDLFTCTTTSTVSGSNFEYYLAARDKAGNTSIFASNPSATAETASSNLVQARILPAGTLSLGGTLSVSGSSNTTIASAYVFTFDIAKTGSVANGSGVYSFTNMLTESYELCAAKTDYSESCTFKTFNTNDSNINLSLNVGTAYYNFSDMGGGAMTGSGTSSNTSGKPRNIFCGPPDNTWNQPTDTVIRCGFDMALDASTVNDTNAADANSNIYLTTNGSDRVGGMVTYCASKSSAGCSSLVDGDTNTILFRPSSSLTAGTYYTFVMNQQVNSESGQSIDGNRSGGGQEIHFSTSAGGGDDGMYATSDIYNTSNFGMKGQYSLPYVRSFIPAPGISIAKNGKLYAEFSTTMNTSTLSTSNIKVFRSGSSTAENITLSVNQNTQDAVSISLTSGTWTADTEYEAKFYGAIADATGITMGDQNNTSNPVFINPFRVSNTTDTTAPTVYPFITDGSTGVAVNNIIEVGFNEAMDPSTLTSSTVTLARGSSSVSVSMSYDAGKNSLFISPTTALVTGTKYTVTLGTGVKDINGVALAASSAFSFTTTTTADTTPPAIKEARADDYRMTVCFTERMTSDGPTSSNYNFSVTKPENYTVTYGPQGSETQNAVSMTGKIMMYDDKSQCVSVEGLSMAIGNYFKVVVSNVHDLSGNTLSSANYINKIENPGTCFSDCGMYSSGSASGDSSAGNSAFKGEGFGNFTGEQFAFGDADMAFPFNQMAGGDANVFQTRFKPGMALQTGDKIVVTFPSGTGLSSAVPDTFSPFYNDLNENFNSGVITFDSTFDTDGVQVDSQALTVTAKVNVSGTADANAPIVLDLRNITNPNIPKGPETGGYTVGIKVLRGSDTMVNKTSMPYFINEAGTRTITANIFVGSQSSPSNVSGNVFLFAGGPTGHLDQQVTISAGTGTKAFTNLSDGCYFIGTEPFVSLGGQDFFGQFAPEPTCVNSTTTSATKNIVLTSAAASSSTLNLTIKITGITAGTLSTKPEWASADLDIFGGGPGRFVQKSISDIGVPASAGYTLPISSSGQWFIGIGPAMPKGTQGMPTPLPSPPPPPIDINVNVTAGTITTGFKTPNGVTVDTATKTITFNFANADKTIAGKVVDATGAALKEIGVDVHSLGFGQPQFTKTLNDGTFSVKVGDYGPYEICAFKDGLPPKCFNIEVNPDGSDAGSDPDVYFKGKITTGSSGATPLQLMLKKPAYYISGKVMNASNNGIGYAPIFASESNGDTANGFTGSDGSYTIFVDAGTWIVKSDLPPNESDTCGSLSKTVTVTTENKTSQNLTPSTSTCVTISGTVTIGSTAAANKPLFCGTWNTTTDRPVPGFFRQTSTDSSGAYQVKVSGNATYRCGTYDPTLGMEIGGTTTVTTSDATLNITSGTTGTITIAFTGGTASMDALAECKKASDKNTRVATTKNGLDSSITMTTQEGTYACNVNVFGIGNFSSSVATGATMTVDLSASSLVSLSGNVNDTNGADLSGALVSARNTSTGVIETAVADSSGNYSLDVKAGSYIVDVSSSGYVGTEAPETVTIGSSGVAGFDFGGASSDHGALEKSTQTIILQVLNAESSGNTEVAMSDGYVWAENSVTGIVVTSPIDGGGNVSLPVSNGTWAVKGVGPESAETSFGNVTVSGSDVTMTDKTLTASSSDLANSVTDTEIIAAATGGVVNSDDTDIKLICGPGECATGSTDVTIKMERSQILPEDTTVIPLGHEAFDLELTTAAGSSVSDLNGQVDIEINYTDYLSSLPSGVSESDLKLAYYSPERDAFVPVEGGYTVDTTNNTITGLTDHMTTFAIVYVPTTSTTTTTTTTTSTSSSSSVGGGSNSTSTSKVATETTTKDTGTTKVTEDSTTKTTSESVKEVPFTDTVGHWAETYISKLYTMGVISGYSVTKFGPNDVLTRAQLTKIVLNTFGIKTGTVTVNPFTDVSWEMWYAPYVSKAQELGIVEGYKDGNFKPDQAVTRAEALKIVFETAAIAIKDDYKVDKNPFKDVPSGQWFTKYVLYGYTVGVIQGYGDSTFKPEQNVTRAEFAKMAVKASEL